MPHSSQNTKEEYGNKHAPEIATKMTNLWEKKIGSKTEHERKGGSSAKKSSPTTVVNSSGTSVGVGVALPEAGSEQASNQLRKVNTKEIVQNFEKMAVTKQTSNTDGNVQKLVKKMSSKTDTSVSQTFPPKSLDQKSASSKMSKDDIYAMIAKLSGSISEMSATLKELKARVDAL